MKYPLVKIHWQDICGGSDWMTLKEAQLWGKKKFEATYFSVGYLLESNKQYVVIAATYDDDVDEPGYNDVSMVMKSVIKKIERL